MFFGPQQHTILVGNKLLSPQIVSSRGPSISSVMVHTAIVICVAVFTHMYAASTAAVVTLHTMVSR